MKEGETKLGVCEIEVNQTEEEVTVPFKVNKACIISVSGCEVTVKSQEAKALDISAGGVNAENTRLVPAVSGMVWEVSGGCASLGIAASKAVSFAGGGELSLVEEDTLAYQPKGGKYTDKQVKLLIFGEEEAENKGSVNCEEAVLHQ